MALTWLDFMCQCYYDTNIQAAKQHGISINSETRDPVQFTTEMLLNIAQNADKFEKVGADLPHPEWAEAHVIQAITTLPYLAGIPGFESIQLSPELLDDFSDAQPPEGVDYLALIQRYKGVYLDLPVERIWVGKNWYIRGIFLVHNIGFVPHLYIVMPRRNCRHLDYECEAYYPFAPERLEDGNFEMVDVNDPNNPINESIPNMVIQKTAANILKLALLYFETCEPENKREMLPQVGREDYAELSNPKKQNNKLRTHTLFKVRKMTPPKDRFGREESERPGTGGWKLQHRVMVRGHFYNQAFGKGHEQHRLRWRKGHWRGPEDTLPKPTLHVLDK